MNGPEHYAEAERLLALADREVSANYRHQTGEDKADVIAAAQVHATLADAAARLVGSEAGYTSHRIDQWVDALGPARPPSPPTALDLLDGPRP